MGGGFHHPPEGLKHAILRPVLRSQPPHERKTGGENMTEATDKEAGIIQALAERMEKQRLPMALALKAKVDQGGLLDQTDIAFLEEAFANAAQLKPLLDTHPEWQELAARILGLYHEITEKALENEQGAQKEE
jgi:hypothetical protein